MIIALPNSYPSNQRPLFLFTNQFYQKYGKYQEFMIEKINEKWSEEMPVLYEIAIFLQDEFIEQYCEQESISSECTITFETGQEAHSYLSMAQAAYRRQFDEEQHNCAICTRDQLGSKFKFMSGCQHYFCTECINDMVVQKLNEG